MWASGSKAVAVTVPTSSLYIKSTETYWYDFVIGDFTRDGTWREKDISGIVPVGTTKVQIRAFLYASGTAHTISWRKGGESNVEHRVAQDIGTENRNYYWDTWVDVSSDRKIEYNITAGGMTTYSVKILGWLKDVS